MRVIECKANTYYFKSIDNPLVDMIDEWLKELKAEAASDVVGMILVHNGTVRALSKDGRQVKGMRLSFDRNQLEATLSDFRDREGIAGIKVWINEGDLRPGDDIMYVLVAGRFRTDVLPVFENLIARIKKEVVRETEILCEVH